MIKMLRPGASRAQLRRDGLIRNKFRKILGKNRPYSSYARLMVLLLCRQGRIGWGWIIFRFYPVWNCLFNGNKLFTDVYFILPNIHCILVVLTKVPTCLSKIGPLFYCLRVCNLRSYNYRESL